MKRFATVLAWTLLYGFLVVFYTNCQQEFEVLSWGSSSHPSTDPDSTDPFGNGNQNGSNSTNFQAGDTLTLNNIPTNDSIIRANLSTYIQAQGFKAIALSSTGRGYMSYSSAFAPFVSQSQEEANRRALEACFIQSDGKPCAVFAEGNRIKYNANVFASAMMQAQLPALNDSFSAADVPWVTDSVRSGILTQYPSLKTSKAIAINIHGAGCYRQDHQNQSESSRRAIQCCEWASKGETCVVFALEDKVVFDITQHYYPVDLSFPLAPANFDPKQVPFVSSEARLTIANSFAENLKDNVQPIALAVNGDGDWAVRLGATDAEAKMKAVAACEQVSLGESCLVYALNNKVVLSLEDLRGL